MALPTFFSLREDKIPIPDAEQFRHWLESQHFDTLLRVLNSMALKADATAISRMVEAKLAGLDCSDDETQKLLQDSCTIRQCINLLRAVRDAKDFTITVALGPTMD
jgi:hypothetical protein